MKITNIVLLMLCLTSACAKSDDSSGQANYVTKLFLIT